MNALTKAAKDNLDAQEKDSRFVKFCIYGFVALMVVAFAIPAVEALAK